MVSNIITQFFCFLFPKKELPGSQEWITRCKTQTCYSKYVFKPVNEVTCYEGWAQAKFSTRCKKKKSRQVSRWTWCSTNLRKGSSGGRKGHGLSVPFNILTTCVLSSLCLCVCGHVCVPLGVCACRLVAHRRQITTEEGEQRAKEMSVLFIETSAKTGYYVKQVESVCACVRSALISVSFTLAWEQKSGAWKAVCLFAVQTLPPAGNNTNLPVLDRRVPKGGSEVESQYSTPVDF